MIRIVFLLLAAVLCAQPARAADRPLPPAFRGVWAAPACAGAQEIVIYGAHFVLRAAPDGAVIEPAALRADDGGFVKIAQGRDTYFLEGGGAALVRTGLRVRGGVWPERLDPRNPALAVTRFESCAAPLPAWAALHPDGLAAFALLNGVRPACDAAGAGCRDALFAAADRDGNAALDYREIALAWRQATFIAAAAPGCPFAALFPGTTAQDGPAAAFAVMAGSDTNGDSVITADEPVVLDARAAALSGALARFLPALPGGRAAGCPH
jgi:hypothetical protein